MTIEARDEQSASAGEPPAVRSTVRSPLRSPAAARRRIELLAIRRDDRAKSTSSAKGRIVQFDAQLELAPKVTDALETLSERLFKEVLRVVEAQATNALQEVLDQEIKLKTEATFKRGAAAVEFSIDNNGNKEDVLRGQGGSVANILSVSLRMLALATLGEDKHRRVLVLDEQDCWLRPDLVPKFVRIVQHAGRKLGFQVIMISHHDQSVFERFADKIYRFAPLMGVVEVREVAKSPTVVDG